MTDITYDLGEAKRYLRSALTAFLGTDSQAGWGIEAALRYVDVALGALGPCCPHCLRLIPEAYARPGFTKGITLAYCPACDRHSVLEITK